MVQIVPAGSLNVNALGADDFYVQIINPPSIVRGVPTDVMGMVGTASWGPVNTPVHVGSGQDGASVFGPVSSLALLDTHDLATDLQIAFSQAASNASLDAWVVRVTDGTDTQASLALTGTASPAAKTVTVAGTIAANDVLTVTFTSAQISGSPLAVTYTVQTGDTLNTVAAGIAAAINGNNALSSALVVATVSSAVVSVYAPSSVTVTLSSSVSSGATETLTVGAGTASTAGITLKAIYSGILGNQIKINIASGSVTSSYTVTIIPPVGLPEVFPNLASINFWQALQNAVNYGLSNYRGPSQYIRASAAIPAVGVPSAGTSTLTGGTDGRLAVGTAAMLGSDTVYPRTGMYALRELNPPVGVVWLSGLVDRTADASLAAFAASEGPCALLQFPAGTTTAVASAATATTGVNAAGVPYLKDWIYWYDQANAITRLVSPAAFIGGKIASLTPEQSPGNKPVVGVVGTERNNPYTGNLPYTPSEIAILEAAGVMFIANPIPAGNSFGIRHGMTTQDDQATAPLEYWRMTSYIARTLGMIGGNYIGQLQSAQPDDPLRAALRLELNDTLTAMRSFGQIDSYLVSCSFSASPTAKAGLGMNTPSSVAAHYLFALVQVKYLSSVRFFVLSLQGGTTVVTVGSNLSQMSPAQ